MYTLWFLLMFLPAAWAQNGALTLKIKGRPVTIQLPGVSLPDAPDPARDYDREILAHSLTFFENCLDASRDPAPPVLTVPNWQALLGLSTRRAQFESSTVGVLDSEEGERIWFNEFKRRERRDFAHDLSFPEDFAAANLVRMAEPLENRLLARAAVISLNGETNAVFIGWLQLQMLALKGRALRTRSARRSAAPTDVDCARFFGDNVVSIRSRGPRT